MEKTENKVKVEVSNLWYSFNLKEGPLLVLKNINLKVSEGEFVSIVGTSGCGKTTLLNILAGFFKPDRGEVYVDGGRVTGPSEKRGMVFQSQELFRWLTVKGNVEFGLKIKGLSKDEREKISDYFIKLVGLNKFKDRYVYELSGGMRQRVAVARSFANSPEILLMDEPMGALDAQTRALLQEELLKIWNETKGTIIFITHSVEEAVFLSNRVVVFTHRPGQIKEEVHIDIPLQARFDYHIKKSKEFLEYTFRLLESVREELAKLHEEE
jgi:ABC-type nitrate/sulfonate/bicarbonate transport system ATPase subunit